MENHEEIYLKQRAGEQRGFTVPEGYFEGFTDRLMQQLPADVSAAAQPTQRAAATARRVALRRWLYAAACVAGIAIVGMTYQMHLTDSTRQTAIMANAAENSYMDEVADYAMVDNSDIYACLADF